MKSLIDTASPAIHAAMQPYTTTSVCKMLVVGQVDR